MFRKEDDERVEIIFQEWLNGVQEPSGQDRNPFLEKAKEIGLRELLERKFSDFDSVCQRFVKPGEFLIPGRRLGDYELVREIGIGSYGVVWEAVDTSLRRPVALKILHPILTIADESERKVRKEAEAASKIYHSSVITVYGVGEVEGFHFIVSELVPGGRTMADSVRSDINSGEDWQANAGSLVPLAEAVHQAHCSGILHRDIKPSNILIDPESGFRLSDFGTALFDQETRRTLSCIGLVGTPNYFSPELICGESATTFSDQWAFGATVFEWLTGEPLFSSQTPAALWKEISEMRSDHNSQVALAVPGELLAIIRKTTNPIPTSRYASMADVASDLRAYSRGEPVKAKPPGLARQLFFWGKRNLLQMSIIASSLFVATILALWSWQSRLQLKSVEDGIAISAELMSSLASGLTEDWHAKVRESSKKATDFAKASLSHNKLMQFDIYMSAIHACIRIEEFFEAKKYAEVAKEIRGISSTKKTQADALYYKCLIETSEIALAISELEGRISELENLPRIQEGDDGDLLLMNRFGVALMQNNNPEYYNRAHKIFQRVEKEYMRRGFQKTTSALLNQLNLAQLETKAKGLGNPTQRLLKAIRVIREKELDSWLETSFFYHALAQAYHYHEFNCEEDAVEWYRKALQQRKIQFGELLPSSLIIKAELALLLFNIGEAKEATREAEEYLSFVQGKKSDHRATDLEGYGAILQKELKNNVMKK